MIGKALPFIFSPDSSGKPVRELSECGLEGMAGLSVFDG